MIEARGREAAKQRQAGDSAGRERNPLSKAIRVLRWMAESDGETWGVREIARGVNLAPSTVHRVLGALEEEGIVGGDAATGQYGLGLEFLRLAWKSTSRLALRNVATPILEDLMKQTNETAFLALFDRSRMQVMFGLSVECTQELRHVVRLNEWVSPYFGASGLAILAFLPPKELRPLLKQFTQLGQRDPALSTVDGLISELDIVRSRRYACTSGQRVSGAIGIAAPIFDPHDLVIADVGLSVPERRFSREDEDRLAELVMGAAATISGQLGGDWPRACEGIAPVHHLP